VAVLGVTLSTDQNLRPLRRTITPYVGKNAIFAGVTVFLIYLGHRISEQHLMWIGPLGWLLYASTDFYFGLKYRVLWDENGVVMRASGGPERRVQYDEIKEIKVETAQPSESLAQSRPFRRIVVYGHKHKPDGFIDISLRHLRPADIDGLLAVIRTHRPDLTVPAIPWGTGSL
jgi:hypothetical protein